MCPCWFFRLTVSSNLNASHRADELAPFGIILKKQALAAVERFLQVNEATMNSIQTQLLATKFFVPVAPGVLIARPRLSALLAESLKHSLTLVSAPAGFGKTMFLS